MKNFFLIAAMLASLFSVHSQPCFDFNDLSQIQQSWTLTQATWDISNPNPLDNTNFLILDDDWGGNSGIRNVSDFDFLGSNYDLNSNSYCLCWDMKVFEDGAYGPTINSTMNPNIRMTDALGNEFIFRSFTTITENDGWIRTCAPIKYAYGSQLPSNSYGFWELPAGASISDFNNAINGDVTISLKIDMNDSFDEIVGFDNVCLKRNCSDAIPEDPCQFEFQVYSESSSSYNKWSVSDFKASVSLSNLLIGYNYEIEWGDGTISFNSNDPHNYSSGFGTYTLCITVFDNFGNSCKKCLEFCFGEVSRDPWSDPMELFGGKHAFEEVTSIIDEELPESPYTIYPNPSRDILFVDSPSNSKYSLYNINAQLLKTGVLNLGNNSIDLNDLKPGIYFLSISGTDVQRFKVIKE